MVSLDEESSEILLNILKAYRYEYSEVANITPEPLINLLLVEFFRHQVFNGNDYQRLYEFINRHNLSDNQLQDFERNDVAVIVGDENGSYYSIFTMSYNSDNQQLNVYSKFREDGMRMDEGEEPLHETYDLSLNQ